MVLADSGWPTREVERTKGECCCENGQKLTKERESRKSRKTSRELAAEMRTRREGLGSLMVRSTLVGSC